MAKTSDFCPRCQSVQVGLRRPDGRFVCLNCSTKEEVVEAASMPVRSYQHEDMRHSRSLGIFSFALGLLVMAAATPITLHYRTTGDASTALLIVLPAGVVPLFMGLIASRNRWGQAGAGLSLLACVQVLFMVLFFEAKNAERPGSVRVTAPKEESPTRVILRPPSPETTEDVTPPSTPTPVVRRQNPAADDEALNALRAKAEKGRRHTLDIRRLQELLNEYYAAARTVDEYQAQRTTVGANRGRLQTQIGDYESRIRKTEVEAKAEAAKRETTVGGVKVTVIGFDPVAAKYAEINRLTQERNVLQAQLAALDAQALQLDQGIAGEQARAGVLGRTVTDHCKRIGEPVPELRFVTAAETAKATEQTVEETVEKAAEKTAESAKTDAQQPKTSDVPPPAPAAEARIRVYVLNDGRTFRAVSVRQEGNTIALKDENGKEHTFLDSDVQEVMLVSVGSEVKQPVAVDTPAKDSPKAPDVAKTSVERKPSTPATPGIKRFLLRDGQAIKAYRVMEFGDEYALQDEDGEIHKVKKNQVREILPAP